MEQLENKEYAIKLYEYLKNHPVKDVSLNSAGNLETKIYGNIVNFLNANSNENPRISLKDFLIMPSQNYLEQKSILNILNDYNEKKLPAPTNVIFKKQIATGENKFLDYSYISNFISGFNTKIIPNEEFYSFCLNLNLDNEKVLTRNEMYEYLLFFLNENVNIINEKAEEYYQLSNKEESFISQTYSKILVYLTNQNAIWNGTELSDSIKFSDETKKYYLVDFDNLNGFFFFKDTFKKINDVIASETFNWYKLENLKLFLFMKIVASFLNEEVKGAEKYTELVTGMNTFKTELYSFYNEQNKKEEE